MRFPTAAGAFALATACSTAAFASGFGVEHHNARAMGAAYAGAEARSGDSGFAVYNPAALAGIKRLEASASGILFWGEARYDNAQGTLLGFAPVTGLSGDDGVLPANLIPASAIAFPVGDRLTLGLTLSSPFGLSSEFAATSVARYYAQNAKLLTIAASPTAAFAVTPWLSVGASLKIEYMDLTASQVVDAGGVAFLNLVPGFLPGSSDLFAEFKGDDVAIGFTAGMQARLSDAVTLGFSYASRVEHDFSGDVFFDLAGSPAAQILHGLSGIFAPSGFQSVLNLPASYNLGVEIAPSDRFRLLGSVGHMRWSVFDQLAFTFDNPAQPPEIVTSNWQDTWSFALGGEFDASARTTLRMGVKFDETPVTDANASPRIPDADRLWLTAGFTHSLNDQLSVDLAGGVVFNEERPIALTGDAPGDALRGSLSADFKTNTYTVGGRLRYQF